MRKKLILILIISIFFLTGCMNPAAVSIVEDMYTEALMEEPEGVAAYFNEAFLDEYPIEALTEELVVHVRNVEGIKLLNTVEVTRNQLNEEITAELDEMYEDEWSYVALDAGENEIMTWVVLRTSTHYEIVDGEKITVDEYNNDVLD